MIILLFLLDHVIVGKREKKTRINLLMPSEFVAFSFSEHARHHDDLYSYLCVDLDVNFVKGNASLNFSSGTAK